MMLISELQAAFSSPAQILGHVSYLLLITSMMMRSMTALRVLAVISGVVEIVYRVFLVPDPVPVFWETLLILVNVYQLTVLWAERFRRRLPADEEYFIRTALPAVNRASARRAVKLGSWVDAEAGERLTAEGVIAPGLIFITAGTVQIEKSGRIFAACGRGDFLGEISFITGQPATADAVVVKPTRYLQFERAAMQSLLDADPSLRNALEASFNRNLSGKLARSTDASEAPDAVTADH